MITLNGYKYSKCVKVGDFYVSADNRIYSHYDGKFNGLCFFRNTNCIGVINDYGVRIEKGDLYKEITKKIWMWKTVNRYVSLSGYELHGEYYKSVFKFKDGLFWCNYGVLGVKEYKI